MLELNCFWGKCVFNCFPQFSINLGSFLDHFGIILGSFWDHFGIILRSFWYDFEIFLASCWHHFAMILGSVWHHFGIIFVWSSDNFGMKMGPVWHHFGIVLVSSLGRFHWISSSTCLLRWIFAAFASLHRIGTSAGLPDYTPCRFTKFAAGLLPV